MKQAVIPEEAWSDIREAIESGRPFHVELDGKDGQVLVWKIEKTGRRQSVDNTRVHAVS